MDLHLTEEELDHAAKFLLGSLVSAVKDNFHEYFSRVFIHQSGEELLADSWVALCNLNHNL